MEFVGDSSRDSWVESFAEFFVEDDVDYDVYVFHGLNVLNVT